MAVRGGDCEECGFRASSPTETGGHPWPVVSVAPGAEFLKRVARVEAEACRIGRYRGMSWSRLTGGLLGSHEFVLHDPETNAAVARWPGDYASHYLAAVVEPDPGFAALGERVHASLPPMKAGAEAGHALNAATDAGRPGAGSVPAGARGRSSLPPRLAS